MTEYTKGDYTSCYASICEIWSKTDDGDEELYATVRLEDADKIIDVLNENEQLKTENRKFRDFIRYNHRLGMIPKILKGDVE